MQLTSDEEQRLTKRHTQNPEAYLLYREANFHLNKFTPEGIANSIAKCQQAIEKDPKLRHGPCGAGPLPPALGLALPGTQANFPRSQKARRPGLGARRRTEPDALSVLATSYMFHDWDWPAAEREFKRAIESDPNIGLTRNLYGFCLAATGRLPEALASIQRGRQLDPLAAPRINEVAHVPHLAAPIPRGDRRGEQGARAGPKLSAGLHPARQRLYVGQGKPDQAIVKMQGGDRCGPAASRRHLACWATPTPWRARQTKPKKSCSSSQALPKAGLEWPFTFLESMPPWATKTRPSSGCKRPATSATRASSGSRSIPRSTTSAPTSGSTRSCKRCAWPTSPPARSASEGSSRIDTLAVLPFDNQSPDPEAGYLGDDITYSLTDSLARVRELKVRPYSSAARFKAGSFDAKTAGRELQVQAVLRGSIQKRGEEIVIDVELIHVGEDRRLWGDRYPGKLADRLTLQQQIIQEVPEKLRLSLTGQEKQALAKLPTQSLKAHELYVQGRLEWNKRTRPGLEKSIELYRQAIDLDPNYALAWAGLAEAYFVHFHSIPIPLRRTSCSKPKLPRPRLWKSMTSSPKPTRCWLRLPGLMSGTGQRPKDDSSAPWRSTRTMRRLVTGMASI